MAVASTDKVVEPLIPSMEFFPSSPSASKPITDNTSDTSSVGNSVNGDPSDQNGQSDLILNRRKDVEIQSQAYLRSEEYRQLFHLPPDEVLVQDFNCAFQESILLQGHMYLFVHHICFYSNIFGFETKKTIPLHEVTCVRKAKTAAIFPNAIEILAAGKKHFFASFLSRDEAYRLIVDGWSQHSNDAEALADFQESKSEPNSQDNVPVLFEKSKSFKQPSKDPNSLEGNEDTHISEHCKLLSNGEVDGRVSTGLSDAQENGDDPEPAVIAESSSSSEFLTWKMEDADAPMVPEYYTMVAESKFLIKVEEFFNLFLSDDAINFTESFHRSCGDKEFRCTSWYEHEQFGRARDVSFQHPIKIYFGARFGHCQEVQKFRVYRDSHLVVETSQVVSDVPYGDYFRVEGLWDVKRDGNEANSGCILRVYTYVAFSKKTIWKGKIEQSTVEECREAYSIWIKSACDLLKQRSILKVEGAKPSGKAIQNGDVQLGDPVNVERSSDTSHNAKNLTRTSQVASDFKNDNQQFSNNVQEDLSDTSSITSLLKESLTTVCLYLKSQSQLPRILVTTFVLILLLMQLSIIVLLTRAPQVHLISQADYFNGFGTSKGERAEAVAWIEKRVHHLKDEMFMVESRLEKMRHEYALLKAHLQDLEQIKRQRR